MQRQRQSPKQILAGLRLGLNSRTAMQQLAKENGLSDYQKQRIRFAAEAAISNAMMGAGK